MSISMKSLLTEFKDDNTDFWRWTENYVDQDQIIVNYTAGTGGEWFAGFLATHEDLADLNTDMRAKKVNKQNRWRINSDLVAKVSNQYRNDYWNTDDYDGSEAYYRKAIANAIEASREHQLREKLQRYRTTQTITRSHEAWCEVHMWPQQFKSLRTITCLNTQDADTWPQFVSNIIKKIWFHEYATYEDYMEEFENKLKKKNIQDKERCLALLKHMGKPFTWYKLVIAITHASTDYDQDKTLTAMQNKWKSEIADEQIQKYVLPLPTPELKIDLLAMLRDKDYEGTYQDVCDFLKITPHEYEVFETLIDIYFAEDKANQLSEQTVIDLIGATVDYAGTYT